MSSLCLSVRFDSPTSATRNHSLHQPCIMIIVFLQDTMQGMTLYSQRLHVAAWYIHGHSKSCHIIPQSNPNNGRSTPRFGMQPTVVGIFEVQPDILQLHELQSTLWIVADGRRISRMDMGFHIGYMLAPLLKSLCGINVLSASQLIRYICRGSHGAYGTTSASGPDRHECRLLALGPAASPALTFRWKDPVEP